MLNKLMNPLGGSAHFQFNYLDMNDVNPTPATAPDEVTPVVPTPEVPEGDDAAVPAAPADGTTPVEPTPEPAI